MKSKFLILLLTFALVLLSPNVDAGINCTATLIDNTTGTPQKIEFTLVAGEELIALGFEKSQITGARVRDSEVYAVISFGQAGSLILEFPNIRADRGARGYIADERTFNQLVTRGKIRTKAFNSEFEYSLELHGTVNP